MLLAHKIELRPTPEQQVYLDKACGSKRHCFNQLLAHFSKPENKWSKNSSVSVLYQRKKLYSLPKQSLCLSTLSDTTTVFK
jgi:putative transposase